jgi:hypothetical protein
MTRYRPGRGVPPQPTDKDVFREDLAKAEHDSVNEREEHVDGQAGE